MPDLIRFTVSFLISLAINAILIVMECKNKSSDSWCGIFAYFFIPVITIFFFFLFWLSSTLISKRNLIVAIRENFSAIIVWFVLASGASFILGLIAFWTLGGILYDVLGLAKH